MTAANPGPFTLDGTRTYVVGSRDVAVIDPGPDLDSHLDAVAGLVEGASHAAILVTHGHPDHAAGAARLARRLGAPLLGAAPGAAPLREGAEVPTDGGRLVVLETPGHSVDHLAFHWPEAGALFAGDLVLGEGDTTWVGEYPGCVSAYLASVRRLLSMELEVIYPAHGPPLLDPAAALRRFVEHRESRIRQVRSALEVRPGLGPEELVREVYGGDLPDAVLRAAHRSVEAMVDHLEREGDPAAG